MTKIFLLIFTILIILGRLFIIYKFSSWLISNYQNPNCNLFDLQWFIGAMLLDFYMIYISRNLDVEIKKETT
jgi:hypothetical protein